MSQFVGGPWRTYLEGKTLATIGDPGPENYAVMARITRTAEWMDPFTFDPIFRIDSPFDACYPSILRNVWVDGQFRAPGYDYLRLVPNVTLKGKDAIVEKCRMSGTCGWTSIYAFGPRDSSEECSGTVISNNLVTSYNSDHHGNYADGISSACNKTTIVNNKIIDSTDVAIILYHATSPVSQQSTVESNYILNAGRSGCSSVMASPSWCRALEEWGGDCNRYEDYGISWPTPPPDVCPSSFNENFQGTKLNNNNIMTGFYTHIHFPVMLGTRPWWGACSRDGFGAEAKANNLGSYLYPLNCNVGILINGMNYAKVEVTTGRFNVNPIDMTGKYIHEGVTYDMFFQGNPVAKTNDSFPSPWGDVYNKFHAGSLVIDLTITPANEDYDNGISVSCD